MFRISILVRNFYLGLDLGYAMLDKVVSRIVGAKLDISTKFEEKFIYLSAREANVKKN
jgi:hypothetical protein